MVWRVRARRHRRVFDVRLHVSFLHAFLRTELRWLNDRASHDWLIFLLYCTNQFRFTNNCGLTIRVQILVKLIDCSDMISNGLVRDPLFNGLKCDFWFGSTRFSVRLALGHISRFRVRIAAIVNCWVCHNPAESNWSLVITLLILRSLWCICFHGGSRVKRAHLDYWLWVQGEPFGSYSLWVLLFRPINEFAKTLSIVKLKYGERTYY